MKHASSSDDSSPTRPTQRDRDTIKLRIEEIKQSRKQLNAAINKIQDDFKEYKVGFMFIFDVLMWHCITG